MPKNAKGSSQEEELVSITEAARILRLTEQTVHALCRRDILKPVTSRRRAKFFHMRDITAYAEVSGKSLGIAEITDIALRAHVLARSTELRMRDLYHSLGYDIPSLETDEESILALYIRADEGRHLTEANGETLIREWAHAFYSIDEAYLALVRQYTGSDEPWKVFIDLSNHLMTLAPISQFTARPDLEAVYSYLKVSRHNLRITSYYFCRGIHGPDLADKVFKENKGIIEEIVTFLMPRRHP